MFLRLTFFLRPTVKILSFLRLKAKFLAVLRLTVNPIEILKGGEGPLTVSTDELALQFDRDFTGEKDDGKQYMRGEFEYRRPYGWNRIAVRVLGRYENDDWLSPKFGEERERSLSKASTQVQALKWLKCTVMRRNSFTTRKGTKLLYRIEFILMVTLKSSVLRKLEQELITGCLQKKMTCGHMDCFSVKSARPSHAPCSE